MNGKRYFRPAIATIAACLIIGASFGESSAAVHYPYKTTVAIGNLPGSEGDGTGGDAPAFADLTALNKYYDAADSGRCNDNCLAAIWLNLAHQGRGGLAPKGMAVTVLRSKPESNGYWDCRIEIQQRGGPGDEWVLCDVLSESPGGL